MNLTLSWDLVIIAFFAIVLAYGFIIGKNQSVKIIVACYIAIIATQGLGNVMARLLTQPPALLSLGGLPLDYRILSLAKLILFAVIVILLVIRSGITVTYAKEPSTVMNLVFTTIYGFATAALMVSTTLTYFSGSGILEASLPASGLLASAVQGSQLMQVLVLNQDVWFTLPALAIVVAGFLSSN